MRHRHGYCAKSPRHRRETQSLALAGLLAFVPFLEARAEAPWRLEKSVTIPAVPPGPYSDYRSIDTAGQRLFATPQAANAVAVIDLRSGTVLRMIAGIGNSHGIYFSAPLKRL